MRRRTTEDSPETAGVNIIPLIDIIFTTLIFFFTVSRLHDFITDPSVTLPQARGATPLEMDRAGRLIVNITREGGVRIASQTYSLEETFRLLGEYARVCRLRAEEPAILVRGDGRCAYQYVQQVMLMCAKYGIWKLDLGTVTPEGL